ncbi:MAG: VOC family protein [Tepidiformaceae bacterium]
MPPTLGNGKICYVEIPARDIDESARFYQSVFGWEVRRRGDGALAFDDGVGQVSGAWVQDRRPFAGEPGVLVHIMVDDAAETLKAITKSGGTIVQPLVEGAPEKVAHFRDPAGNLFGIYQEPG